MFGAILIDYSTIDLAAITLLRALMLDYNYKELFDADSSISAFFFVTFLVSF